MLKNNKMMFISSLQQELICFEEDQAIYRYSISTGKNGMGELVNSECTPRGWHKIHAVIGAEYEKNSVFVGRQWTGELYSPDLAEQYPGRDWILTRIIQIDGLEPGRNKGGNVDSLERYIYIHGTPDSTQLGIPGSRGCIRMKNDEIVHLAQWVTTDTLVCIE